MKALSKAEFIAKIEAELPDDAQIYGYSTNAGEFFPMEEYGNIFTPTNEYFGESEDQGEYIPEEVTHLFESS